MSASRNDNILHVDSVTMQFGGVVAVNNLSLDVNKGEIVALIGPNGAGKTTAFNVITGVYEPTNGKVSFKGETMVENHPQGKMRRQYLGENEKALHRRRRHEVSSCGVQNAGQDHEDGDCPHVPEYPSVQEDDGV